MNAVTVSDHAASLILEHGSVRAAANAVGVDHAYLHKLAMGAKWNPSKATLRKLGLMPTPLYLKEKP